MRRNENNFLFMEDTKPVFVSAGETDSHTSDTGGQSSPPVPCHSEPVRTLAWESVSQRGAAALTGRRTPRAFVPLRSTAGHRPLRVDNAPAP